MRKQYLPELAPLNVKPLRKQRLTRTREILSHQVVLEDLAVTCLPNVSMEKSSGCRVNLDDESERTLEFYSIDWTVLDQSSSARIS